MVYLFNEKLWENSFVFLAFAQIYGIGRKASINLCKRLGLSLNLKVWALSKKQLLKFKQIIEKSNLIIAWNLKMTRLLLRKVSIEIKSYKGLWWIKGLPIRGQRTRTNAKTAKTGNKRSKT